MNAIRTSQAIAMIALLGATTAASAAVTGGDALPWEAPLQTLVDSLTGPVAFAGSAVALAAAFLTLVFNNDMTGLGRYLVYLALAVSGLLFITNLLTTLFGAGADTSSPLVALQLASTFIYIALCAAMAALQWMLWRLVSGWWHRARHTTNTGKIEQSVKQNPKHTQSTPQVPPLQPAAASAALSGR